MHKEINGLIGININLMQFTFNFTLQQMKLLCSGVIRELSPLHRGLIGSSMATGPVPMAATRLRGTRVRP